MHYKPVRQFFLVIKAYFGFWYRVVCDEVLSAFRNAPPSPQTGLRPISEIMRDDPLVASFAPPSPAFVDDPQEVGGYSLAQFTREEDPDWNEYVLGDQITVSIDGRHVRVEIKDGYLWVVLNGQNPKKMERQSRLGTVAEIVLFVERALWLDLQREGITINPRVQTRYMFADFARKKGVIILWRKSPYP